MNVWGVVSSQNYHSFSAHACRKRKIFFLASINFSLDQVVARAWGPGEEPLVGGLDLPVFSSVKYVEVVPPELTIV